MEISFSPRASWSEDRESLLLSADADGTPVLCVVSQEFLTAPYAKKLGEAEARELFDDRREEIETLLRDRILRRLLDSKGEVILRSRPPLHP